MDKVRLQDVISPLVRVCAEAIWTYSQYSRPPASVAPELNVIHMDQTFEDYLLHVVPKHMQSLFVETCQKTITGSIF